MKNKNLKRFFAHKLRNLDVFGHKVELTMNGQEQFKTITGGCLTLLSLISMVAYFAFSMV